MEKAQHLEQEKKALSLSIGTIERTLNKIEPRVENLKKVISAI